MIRRKKNLFRFSASLPWRKWWKELAGIFFLFVFIALCPPSVFSLLSCSSSNSSFLLFLFFSSFSSFFFDFFMFFYQYCNLCSKSDMLRSSVHRLSGVWWFCESVHKWMVVVTNCGQDLDLLRFQRHSISLYVCANNHNMTICLNWWLTWVANQRRRLITHHGSGCLGIHFFTLHPKRTLPKF